LPEKFWFLLKDARYQFWNGQISLVNVVLGKGAFKAGPDFNDANDLYSFGAGSARYWLNGPAVNYNSGGYLD